MTLEFQELPSDLVYLLVMRRDGSGVVIPTHWSFTEEVGAGSTVALFFSSSASFTHFNKSSEPIALKIQH